MPDNWPPGFQYSPVSVYIGPSPSFFHHLLSSTDPQSCYTIADCIENQRVHPHLEIRKIESKAHPLAGQYGVFAKASIPKETDLGEYVGEVSFGQDPSSPSSEFKGVHCWRVACGSLTLNISSSNIANELAFVNDFRGLQSEPTVGLKWIVHRGVRYFGFATLRTIEPQEELLVDYGKTWGEKILYGEKRK